MAEAGTKFEYQVGTMIELPRACVTADQSLNMLISSPSAQTI